MAEAELMTAVVALLGAVAFAAVAYALLYPFVSSDRQQEKRLQSVKSVRPRAAVTRSAADTAADRRKAVAESLKDIENRRNKERLSLRLRLQQAGMSMTPRTFWIASIIAGLVVGAGAYVALLPSHLAILGGAIAGFVVTFGVARWYVGMLIRRRQAKFLADLANAIDVVVRGVKSGLPLNECLGIIARESPEPLASEFREVVDQQRMGVTLGEGLERLVARMPLPEVKFLAIVISIQQQAGGNLSEALGNLSSVLRDRFHLKLKVKALSAEAKASAVVLASLPPLVMSLVYLSSPKYIMPLFTSNAGNLVVGVGGLWMVIGVLVMRKLINFKY